MSVPLRDLRLGVSETVDMSAEPLFVRKLQNVHVGDAPTEEELERHIQAAMDRMCEATDRTLKIQYMRELHALMDQRTPARRRFMQRLRGMS